MEFRDVFDGFKFAAFSNKDIVVAVAVIASLSLIEYSMYFLLVKTIHLLFIVPSYLRLAASFL